MSTIRRKCYSLFKARYHFISGSCSIPHPQKRHSGGEDAYFIEKYVVGVADGVGGWQTKGIDSGRYSRDLMRFAQFFSEPNDTETLLSPKEILSGAYAHVKALGSSTACIVQIQDTRIHSLNIGDSGYMVCRREGEHWQKIFQSSTQTHYFNCPFQLGHESSDRPKDGAMEHVDSKVHDIVITATDGLLDNVFENELLHLLSKTVEFNQPNLEYMMEHVAKRIAQTAHHNATKQTGTSPFSLSAKKAGHRYVGGKMDDITVVASVVMP